MTKQEAINGLKALSKEFSGYKPNEEMFGMAINALELEQRILENGYTGKEAEFRIGGRLFGIREKAQ